MNLTLRRSLESELRIMDMNDLKPNYAALGRKYGLDYRTVKRYHNGYEGKSKSRKKKSKLDKYKAVIIEKFSIPRITRKGVYEFLVDMHDADKIGTYSNFKAYCRKNNLKPVGKNYISGGNTRYETEPGDMAQADWKENISLTSKFGEIFVVNIFHLVLKYSRYSYIELTLSKEQPVVFRCMINAFEFYGGIPKRVLFDNMSTIVDVNTKPKRINTRAVQFAKDINFRIDTCKARHPYTKGTNEARNKMLDWLRAYDGEFETFEELQNIVYKLNTKMNTEKCEGTDSPPCLLFHKEKEYMNSLPNRGMLERYIAPTKVKVSKQQLILYKGIQYSLDKSYVGKFVQPEEFNDMLQIYYNGKLIQVHQLSKNPINYKEEHYRQTIGDRIRQENMEEVVSNNLRAMDQLLEKRTVVVTKEDACKSHHALMAYLLSRGAASNWIKRFIQTLSKEEKTLFLDEITKILPYVVNEEQFILAFKHAADKKSLRTIRVNFWGLDIMESYNFLDQEGYDSIYKDFKRETEKYLDEIKHQWE